jgi:hypothetical protein
MAKLAEQAERYDEMVAEMDKARPGRERLRYSRPRPLAGPRVTAPPAPRRWRSRWPSRS